MRKPRDYDAELKALDDRAKDLKAKKVSQLGELVIATGADIRQVSGFGINAHSQVSPVFRHSLPCRRWRAENLETA